MEDEENLTPAPPRPAADSKAPPTAAATPTPRALPALKPLPRREAARVRKLPIEAVLDLHGLTKLEAYERVGSFLCAQVAGGVRHVLIITGKGRQGEGVLRQNLPHWLNEPALRRLVAGFVAGRPEKGGDGVMHVLLRSFE
jgi:DNA-nicking Smr family endonuclease